MKFLLVLIMGTVMVDLLMLYIIQSGKIRRLRRRDGTLIEPLTASVRFGMVLAGVFLFVYLLVADLLVLGYNELAIGKVLMYNVAMVQLLVVYEVMVIEHWLILEVRPMFTRKYLSVTREGKDAFVRFVLVNASVYGTLIAIINTLIYQSMMGTL